MVVKYASQEETNTTRRMPSRRGKAWVQSLHLGGGEGGGLRWRQRGEGPTGECEAGRGQVSGQTCRGGFMRARELAEGEATL